MGGDPSCPICGFDNETVMHALLCCPAAVASWFVCPLGFRNESITGGSFVYWFTSLKAILDKEQLDVAAMVAWSIWSSWNSAIHGEKVPNPAAGIARSFFFFTKFQAARSLLQTAVPRSSRTAQNRWQKPPNMVVKINCDASVKGKCFVGIGFVIRDSLGKVLRAGVDRIQEDIGVNCTEALVIYSTLCFSKDCMFNRMIVESDSESETSYLNEIVEDCRVINKDFTHIVFNYVGRTDNRVAHGLAAIAQSMNFNVPTFWIEEVHFNIILSSIPFSQSKSNIGCYFMEFPSYHHYIARSGINLIS